MSSLTAYVAGGYWVYDYAIGDEAVNPIADLQSINPSAVIELFELQLVQSLHGSNDVYRFHAGANLNANGTVYWNGQSYDRFPIEADGFEYSGNGQLPQPKIRVSNINGTITAILLIVNGITTGNDLIGAKVTRLRTLARYIDAANFPGGVNPYGTPDPNVEMPREVYYIIQKSIENRELVEFTLASAFDLQGVRAPKRQCISNICQWIYKGDGCGYSPITSFNGTYSYKDLSGSYTQSGNTITITSTSHGISAGEQIYLSRGRFSAGTYSQIGSLPAPSSLLGVTATAHGFQAGETVTLTFTSGSPPSNGDYVIISAETDSFTVNTPPFVGTRTGNVDIASTSNLEEFYTVATAATNTLTVTAGTSSTQTASYNLKWLKITYNNHGLAVGEVVYLSFTSGLATSITGRFTVASSTANTFTVFTISGVTTSGNVTGTQWYDDEEVPVYVSTQDVCGKRLESCEARFGENNRLPFGSFPGIGTYYS